MKENNNLLKELLEILRKETYLDNDLIKQIEDGKNDKNIYKYLLEYFIHENIGPVNAKKYWQDIIEIYKKYNGEFSLISIIINYFIKLFDNKKNNLIIETYFFKKNNNFTIRDKKTKAFSKKYFDIQIIKELKRSIRYNKVFSIALLDIDNFKIYNDSKGYSYGDKILFKFAEFLKNEIRTEDILCRYKDDKFIMILPETDLEGAKYLIERIQKDIRMDEFFIENKLTFSAGISSFPSCGRFSIELVDYAERSLYKAKKMGKNKIIAEYDL